MIQQRNIEQGYSIFDYSSILLGGFDNMMSGLVRFNPDFNGIDVDLSDFVTIYWDDSYYQSKPTQLSLVSAVSGGTTVVNTGFDGQSLFDVVLQVHGGFDLMMSLLKSNDFGINDMSVVGIPYIFDSSVSSDPSLKKVISKRSLVFSSLVYEETSFRLLEDGGIRLLENGNNRLLE